MRPLRTSALRATPLRLLLGTGGVGVIVALTAALAFGGQAGDDFALQSSTPVPTPAATRAATPEPTASPTPQPTPAPPVATCPLDGVPLTEGVEVVEPALAVQIENHPHARPARNLGNADMVVETTVEGDATRFTGIFLCDATVGMTGPVRSARYYNIDLWQDLHVLTVGFGRSDGAQERFVAAGMPYPNGMEGWPWYRRWGPRAAPHNLYVDLEAMRAALSSDDDLKALAGRVDELRPPFTFSESADLPESPRVDSVDIRTNPYWHFGWRWDDDAGAWLRSDAGVQTVDEVTGERLAFTTLVVQRVSQETVYGDPDPAGNPRRLHHLVGSGDGVIYTDGRAIPVRWERATAADATEWTWGATGEPVELPPGPVWWHILPHEAEVSEG